MGHGSARPLGRVWGKIQHALVVAAACSTFVAVGASANADVSSPWARAAAAKATPATQPRSVADSSAPVWLEQTAQEPAVLAFPPRKTGRRPIAVMLHGMCDPPERECPYFANSVTEFAWLVCPRARLGCAGGGTMWDWVKKYETVDSAVERMRQYDAATVDAEHDRILIGFSLGALAAMDIAHRARGQWPKLLLIGAEVYPNATLLKRAGVKRVLLASGERDMMRWHMTQQAERLNRQGVPARYMSLGPVGHWFAPDMDTWMRGALSWLQSDDAAEPEPADERRAEGGRSR
jgi:predicted esterase